MKMLFKSLAVILGLILLAMLALVFLVDANRFKPRIEALANDQGVALHIGGDLGWALWPSLGVDVNQVSLAALDNPTAPIAELQQASLLLKLMPLLSGDFQVDHIVLDGLQLKLIRDQTGKGNWEAFTSANHTANSAGKTPAAEPSAESELKLDIQQLSLANTRVDYQDAQRGQSLSLRDLNLTLAGVNTRNEPFALEAGFSLDETQSSGEKLAFIGQLNAQLSVDKALNNLALSDGRLQLNLSTSDKASVALTYAATIKELQQGPTYQGQLTLKEANVRQLLAALGVHLETAGGAALTKLALSTNFTGDSDKLKLDNLELLVDDTALKGTASVTYFATPSIKASLIGEELNLDDYLSPRRETKEVTAAPATDTPFPLESLRTLNLNVKLALQKLIVNQLDLQNLEIKLLAKSGMLESNVSALAYSGKISAKSQLDARAQLAQLQFDAGVEGLELAPLLKDMKMDSKFGLQGAIQVRALGGSQGNSTSALIKALRANANFSGAQVRASPINLEQQFCKMVNLVNQVDDPVQAWNEYTEMNELSGSVKWRDQIITIDTFKAGVEKLQLSSTGKINLANDQYDVLLPFKLLKDKTDTVTAEQVAVATSVNGCSVGSYYWVERGLELLRCKGSLADINPLSDCRPDKALLVELTKDYAVYKLKEKHGAKLDAKKLELKEKVEAKKNQLLEKLQKKLNNGAVPSVSATSAAVSSAVSEPAALSESSVAP